MQIFVFVATASRKTAVASSALRAVAAPRKAQGEGTVILRTFDRQILCVASAQSHASVPERPTAICA